MSFASTIRRRAGFINLTALIAAAPLVASELEITTGVDPTANRLRVPSPDELAQFAPRVNLPDSPTAPSAKSIAAQMAIAFEPANNDRPDAEKFVSRGAGYGLALLKDQIVVQLQGAANSRSAARMKFAGANPTARMEATDPLPGHANYYIGSDPAKWRTHVPQFARVRYHEIYKGIDLVFYGKGRELEYDLIVAPGVDPNQIRLTIEGGDKVALDSNGDALVRTAAGDLRLRKPLVYQEIDGVRREIEGQFAMLQAGGRANSKIESANVGFHIAQYDTTKTLVIDPMLRIAGVGGSQNDFGFGLAVDRRSTIYLTGSTVSTDFQVSEDATQPANAGGSDVFVTAINRDGSGIIYSTYLGGTKDDVGLAIAVHPEGLAFITGYTASSNFPVLGSLGRAFGGGGADAFVTAVDLDGTLFYSTFLGGSGVDQGNGIAQGEDGSIYISGFTNSTNFPTMKPLQPANAGGFDFFVSRLNPTGTSLIYSTYLGGSGDEGPGYGPDSVPSGGIAVDIPGNAYIGGATNSVDFPTVNGFQPTPPEARSFSLGDAFLTKIKPDGAGPLLYSTYFGGTNDHPLDADYDAAFAVAVDGTGRAALAGTSRSKALPTRNAPQSSLGGSSGYSRYGDGFLAIFDPQKIGDASLIFSTYTGGNGDDAFFGVTFGADGTPIGTGITSSTNFPFTSQLSGGSIFRSTDNGGTWHRANKGLVGANPELSPVLVSRLVLDPSDATHNTAYAGTRFGGIFKTTTLLATGGPTWVEKNNGITDHFITGLAVDPLHPGTAFAGTQFGSVFKSVDGGTTWTEMSAGLGFDDSNINSFAFTPTAVFCGIPGGLGVAKTTDGGAHWLPANTGLENKHVEQVIIDPANPNNSLYAVTSGIAGTKAGIYKSTNGGAQWAPDNGNIIDKYFANTAFLPRAMAFVPGASGGRFVLVDKSFNGPNGGLFESVDGGKTYSQLVGFGFTGSTVLVTDNTILISGSSGLYVSEDGGAHWKKIGLEETPITAVQKPAGTSTLVAAASGGDSGVVVKYPAAKSPSAEVLAGTSKAEVREAALNKADGRYYQLALAGAVLGDMFDKYPRDAVVPPLPSPTLESGTLTDVPNTHAAVITESPPPTAVPTPQAHLVVTKTCTPDPAKPGADITCTIILTNKGPDTATKVDFTENCSLNDPAKAQKTIDKPNDVDATPLLSPKDIRFDLPDLAKDQSRTVKITYKSVTKELNNRVIAYSATFDPGPVADNTKKVKVPVNNNAGPKVDAVNPNKGKPGATTTIEGSGLNGGQKVKASSAVAAAVATSTVVKFNGIVANIVSISDTQIVVQVPAGATTGPVTVTTAAGTATSAQEFIVLPAIQQLLNISTRLKVLTGENVLIGGFIVTGKDDKKVLLRAIGPSLASGGVAGALADPVLELHSGGTVVATNDNWKSTQQAEIEATTIPPSNALESAMVRTLAAHTTGYTAIVSGKGGATGVGLVEAYDLNQANSDSQLANISTRGFVDTGDNVMIGGVIVGGGASANTARVLVRGIGPSLGAAGVQGALQDPTLELHNSNGAVVAQNDNWQDTQKPEIIATTIPPTKDAESAIVRTLSAGNYTAILRGKSGTTGVALVELYNLH